MDGVRDLGEEVEFGSGELGEESFGDWIPAVAGMTNRRLGELFRGFLAFLPEILGGIDGSIDDVDINKNEARRQRRASDPVPGMPHAKILTGSPSTNLKLFVTIL